MEMKISATLETRTFKNGNFEVLVLKLSNNVEKLVFLTQAEKECLNLTYKKDDFWDKVTE